MTQERDLSHADSAGAVATRQLVMVAPCRPWGGTLTRYQILVQEEARQHGALSTPHMWAAPTCDTKLCLEHIAVAAPRRIAYPNGVCVYCGNLAGTLDHLLPRAWSGDTGRRFVATVPACAQCNSYIGDRGSYRISERRAIAKAAIRKGYARVLRTPHYSRADLAEYGPTLRAHILHAVGEQAQTRERLKWPLEPDYDLRAFQKSGIEDPNALELL